MCDCKLAIPGTFNVLVDSVSTMSVFSPEKHAVFCEFILPVNVNSCELRTQCIFQYYQDHYHMIWSPCHFNYYLFFCCITFNFQLTGHSSIDFSNQLQTWIHWRFYFSSFLSLAILLLLCLPSSAPKNSCLQSFWCFDVLMMNLMILMIASFSSLWHLHFIHVASKIPWEWQRNGRCSFCSGHRRWYRGECFGNYNFSEWRWNVVFYLVISCVFINIRRHEE